MPEPAPTPPPYLDTNRFLPPALRPRIGKFLLKTAKILCEKQRPTVVAPPQGHELAHPAGAASARHAFPLARDGVDILQFAHNNGEI